MADAIGGNISLDPVEGMGARLRSQFGLARNLKRLSWSVQIDFGFLDGAACYTPWPSSTLNH